MPYGLLSYGPVPRALCCSFELEIDALDSSILLHFCRVTGGSFFIHCREFLVHFWADFILYLSDGTTQRWIEPYRLSIAGMKGECLIVTLTSLALLVVCHLDALVRELLRRFPAMWVPVDALLLSCFAVSTSLSTPIVAVLGPLSQSVHTKSSSLCSMT